MNINQWQTRHRISHGAMQELRAIMTHNPVSVDTTLYEPNSEAANLVNIRLEASASGSRLWRNNVGAAKTDTGSFVRYGLCNDSAQMNKVVKSSDLIGIRPIYITMDHVGTTIGQFIAREVKKTGWEFNNNDDHERAQLKFLEMITGYGGCAKFVSGVGTL